MKKMSDARKDLIKCVELKIDYIAGVKGLAETSFHLGYCQEAAGYYNRLLSLKTTGSKPPTEKEVLEIGDRRQKSTECAAYLDKSLELRGRNEVKAER